MSRPLRSRATVLGLAVVLSVIAFIGWLDNVSGPEMGLALFYLIPIVGTGWWLGRRAAAVAAVVASVVSLVADLPFARFDLSAGLWHALTALVVFGAAGALMARLRSDREELSALNGRLEELLAAEALLARTDPLTRLPNSRAFLETLALEAARSRRSRKGFSVAYVDIDNFKVVNDRWGHEAGDELLRRVASAIKESVRAADVPARLGGDEFAVLLLEVPGETLEEIAARIVSRVDELAAEHPGAGLGASVGIACFAVAPDDPAELLRAADAAMYEAKQTRRGVLIKRHAAPASPVSGAAESVPLAPS